MLYAILCYNSEAEVCSWTPEHDALIIGQLEQVENRLARDGRLGPVVRLMPTTAATTLRKDREPALVIDGPFAETKEQLLGFFIVECTGLEQALETARDLGKANPGGAYEIRPLSVFKPGTVQP